MSLTAARPVSREYLAAATAELSARFRTMSCLTRALRDPAAEVRRRAVLDLGREPSAVDALVATLPGETDPRVRKALLTALAGLDGSDVAQALVPLLRGDDTAAREAVISALHSEPKGLEPVVAALLRQRDVEVRLLVAARLAGPRDH